MAEKWIYNRDELLDLYIDKRMSILSIAKIKESGYKAVRNALIREGVVLRANNTTGLHITSEKTKEKISIALKGRKAKPLTAEAKQKHWYACFGRKHSPETKAKMSRVRIEKGLSAGERNPMKREECVRRWIASNKISPNKQELRLYDVINQACPNTFGINTKGEIAILDGAIPDFVSTNNTKKIIELYGDYWHRGDNEQDRIDRLAKLGYKTLIIWESELADVNKLKKKLMDFNDIH